MGRNIDVYFKQCFRIGAYWWKYTISCNIERSPRMQKKWREYGINFILLTAGFPAVRNFGLFYDIMPLSCHTSYYFMAWLMNFMLFYAFFFELIPLKLIYVVSRATLLSFKFCHLKVK